jgi:hypothetical protein
MWCVILRLLHAIFWFSIHNLFWVWGFTAVDMKYVVFWVVTPCSSERAWRFGGTSPSSAGFLYWLTLWPWIRRQYLPPKLQDVSEISCFCWFLACLAFVHWRLGRYVPPKRRNLWRSCFWLFPAYVLPFNPGYRVSMFPRNLGLPPNPLPIYSVT